MKEEQTHIFPSRKAEQLDNKIRRLLQNPYKILAPFISKGMTVLDYGCGNGYFSIPLSKMVDYSGKVFAVDIQKEMLDKLTVRLQALNISNITAIQRGSEKLNLPELVDFAIAVYVVHEIPDKKKFFRDVFDLLKPNGRLMVIEPDFIVSGRKFKETLEFAKQAGFIENEKLNLLLSKSGILLKK
jgi:ubiquinone/menaquinone biosynthesis C-methylase UbiE